MKKIKRSVLLILVLLGLTSHSAFSQKMALDGKFGLSFLTGNGNSSTGLLIGGGLDIPFQQGLFFRPELNITTHGGTPIELAGNLKYFLPTSPLQTDFYIDGGLGFWFYSGGSALGIDAGAGTIFPLSGSNLKIPAEIRIGPIFESGSSAFQIALTTGVRFDVP